MNHREGADRFQVMATPGLARGPQLTACQAYSYRPQAPKVAVFRHINHLCSHIAVPSTVVHVAKQLFKRAADERLLRWKHYGAIVAACIFIACRRFLPGSKRSFKEIASLTNVSLKLLCRCLKLLTKSLKTSVEVFRVDRIPVYADAVTIRFCNRLRVPVPVRIYAIFILRRCAALRLLNGRSSLTAIVSACFFFATGLFKCQIGASELMAVAGITYGSLHKAYKCVLLAFFSCPRLDQGWICAPPGTFMPRRTVYLRQESTPRPSCWTDCPSFGQRTTCDCRRMIRCNSLSLA
jgi:transcription initiation factor TFIIB